MRKRKRERERERERYGRMKEKIRESRTKGPTLHRERSRIVSNECEITLKEW